MNITLYEVIKYTVEGDQIYNLAIRALLDLITLDCI